MTIGPPYPGTSVAPPPNRPLPAPGQVIARLEILDQDLIRIRRDLENAAERETTAKGRYELALAKKRVEIRVRWDEDEETKDRKQTVDEVTDRAILALEKSGEYVELWDARGAHEGAQAAFKVVDARRSIAQSELNAMTKGPA